ncbi:uncharacterized protein LOC135100983 [Scylla paramamosain]|uniref:uncharacterized protein LOC135100983 n=1 Tax=Scylla paramamosain TaxID=85552 RepID=UPI0030834842
MLFIYRSFFFYSFFREVLERRRLEYRAAVSAVVVEVVLARAALGSESHPSRRLQADPGGQGSIPKLSIMCLSRPARLPCRQVTKCFKDGVKRTGLRAPGGLKVLNHRRRGSPTAKC